MATCNPKKKVLSKQAAASRGVILAEWEWRLSIWKAWRASGLTVHQYLKTR